MQQFKKTAWWSSACNWDGWVSGVSGGKWSFEIVEIPDFYHPNDTVPVARGTDYESEDEAFRAMSSFLGKRGHWIAYE